MNVLVLLGVGLLLLLCSFVCLGVLCSREWLCLCFLGLSRWCCCFVGNCGICLTGIYMFFLCWGYLFLPGICLLFVDLFSYHYHQSELLCIFLFFVVFISSVYYTNIRQNTRKQDKQNKQNNTKIIKFINKITLI